MTPENRRVNAGEELALASEALGDAETLFREEKLRGAISRGYYALLHGVRALLVARGLEARTHQGAETLFHQHYLRTKDIDAEWGAVFARMQSYRERADYGPPIEFTTPQVRRELDGIARFLTIAKDRIG